MKITENMGQHGTCPMSPAVERSVTGEYDLYFPRSLQNGPIAGARLTATDMGHVPCCPMSVTRRSVTVDTTGTRS
jgi:hypothetical protein